MLENMVPVRSAISGTVVLSLPEFHFRRVWQKKGAIQYVDKDVLRNSIFDDGVSAMFRDGDLIIDDLSFKKQIGLQPEDAVQTTLVELDDKLCNRLTKLMPVNQVVETIKKLSDSQREELVSYMVQHSADIKMDRIESVNKLCHTDLLKKIELTKKGQE